MNIPEPMFTPVYDLGNGEDTTILTVIKQNREDEKNTRSIIFASRLRRLSNQVMKDKLDYAQIAQLLESEANHIEHQAQELNYV
ncbi:DUF2732 domain-containing protein [Providencia rettgeri]|uniref:DUF2732 family protein n=1 Tax=Providencia rettgeri TaxID=587 RepID=UPI001F04D659|nr:DUF2732 family protein [Providencia rettgeri]MCG9950769.1 DUF2732 domain-containing protein [Providencia rettgeri]